MNPEWFFPGPATIFIKDFQILKKFREQHDPGSDQIVLNMFKLFKTIPYGKEKKQLKYNSTVFSVQLDQKKIIPDTGKGDPGGSWFTTLTYTGSHQKVK